MGVGGERIFSHEVFFRIYLPLALLLNKRLLSLYSTRDLYTYMSLIPPDVFWSRWADNAIHFALGIFQIIVSPTKISSFFKKTFAYSLCMIPNIPYCDQKYRI